MLFPIICLADTHVIERNNRLKEFEVLVSKLELAQKKIKAQTLVICGDLFDKNADFTAETVFLLVRLFKLFKFVYIVAGNHDVTLKVALSDRELEKYKYYSVLYFLFLSDKVRVFFTTKDIRYKGNYFVFLPYYAELPNFKQYKGKVFVFSHKDIYELNRFPDKEFAVSLDDFKFSHIRVFNGHLHKNREKGNFISIGSPYPTRRDELSEDNNYCYVIYSFNKVQRLSFNITYNEVEKSSINTDLFRFCLTPVEKTPEDEFKVDKEKLREILENSIVLEEFDFNEKERLTNLLVEVLESVDFNSEELEKLVKGVIRSVTNKRFKAEKF